MMADFRRIKSTHIATQQETEFNYHDPGLDVDYPSDWFEKNAGGKPVAVIPHYTGPINDLVRAVKGGIRAASLSVTTAKIYLHRYGARMTARSDTDWVTFDREIALRDTAVTPWSILTVVEGDRYETPEPMLAPLGPGTQPARPPEDPSNWTERSLVLYILGIYRLTKVTNDEYAETLEQRMGAQVAAEGGKGITFHGARNIYSSWASDKTFLKMVAAYDMFLHKFKDHPDAILRMGSLGSRYRDCAGLLSLGFALSILNIEAGDLMDWIYIKTMGDEMLRVSRPNQETGDPDSYFPYQSDMGLVTKSAYSSNANPYLFTWVHVIGSLIGHRRSQNARFIFEGSYADLGLNAVLVTWVFARGGGLTPQFDSEGVDYGMDIEAGGEADGDDAGPTPEDSLWLETQGRVPKTWYALLKSGGFKVPGVVQKAIKRQREKIKDARESTVGEFCKNQLIY